MADSSLIPVDLVALVEDQASSSPIVILHDRRQNRLLPIWIGDPEARAIAIALNRMSTPRPMTHALVLQIIEKMNGKLSRIVVDRLKNNTYFASLHINMTERAISIDARPSDAIAVALQARVPIFVEKAIMDVAGQNNPFPGSAMRQEKRQFSQQEMAKLKELLEKARERERKSGGER